MECSSQSACNYYFFTPLKTTILFTWINYRLQKCSGVKNTVFADCKKNTTTSTFTSYERNNDDDDGNNNYSWQKATFRIVNLPLPKGAFVQRVSKALFLMLINFHILVGGNECGRLVAQVLTSSR